VSTVKVVFCQPAMVHGVAQPELIRTVVADN
jgi:hypothetical protein